MTFIDYFAWNQWINPSPDEFYERHSNISLVEYASQSINEEEKFSTTIINYLEPGTKHVRWTEAIKVEKEKKQLAGRSNDASQLM